MKKYNEFNRKIELDLIKKRINIVEFLSKHHYTPDAWDYNKAWYISPLREKEKTASFCVYVNKNDWYDFGAKIGGSIIDLVIHLHQMNYVDAVKMLRKTYHTEFMKIKEKNEPLI